MSKQVPVERGPNYDWKHEALHYRDELEKSRDLVRMVERSSDSYRSQLTDLRKQYDEMRERMVQVMKQIKFVTAPRLDAGGYHENAYSLASNAIAKYSPQTQAVKGEKPPEDEL